MATSKFVYQMQRLNKVFPGGREVLKDISLSFLPGAKIGVVGDNGSGKSTLLRIMAGQDTEFDGEAAPGKGVRVGYLPQEPTLDPTKNVRDNVMDGVDHLRKLNDDFGQVMVELSGQLDDDEMEEFLQEQQELQEKMDATGAWNIQRRSIVAMEATRCPLGEQSVENLSGGERRRVALARTLLSYPDLLLLDEPTNHLDAETVAWLEYQLSDYRGTVVIITHDRYFLDNVAEWILELDRGQGIPFQGNYSAWLEAKEKRIAQEGREDAARQRTIRRELEWIRESPRARQAKSTARIKRYKRLVAQSERTLPEVAQIPIPPGPRLGDIVIEAENVQKAFGRRIMISGLSFKLQPGAIVGIVGPNGTGKTTLLRMIAGQEPIDSGTLKLGDTVQLGYVDQSRDDLDPDKTVWEEISEGQDVVKIGPREVSSRAYVGAFNIKGADQQKRVGQLSGGERNRVCLAKMLKESANVLLLDEPTNDLDVNTLRALEDALTDYAGCVLVVSHDRWFLDRLCTHIIAFEGDSDVVWFEGNYHEYENDRRSRRGMDASQPRRIRYKLTD